MWLHPQGYKTGMFQNVVNLTTLQSNFVVGLYPSTRSEVYLIDFGLARKFTTTTGEIKQERDFTGFRYIQSNSGSNFVTEERPDMHR